MNGSPGRPISKEKSALRVFFRSNVSILKHYCGDYIE